jgi:hypothetical protein
MNRIPFPNFAFGDGQIAPWKDKEANAGNQGTGEIPNRNRLPEKGFQGMRLDGIGKGA